MTHEGSPSPERRNYRPHTLHSVDFDYPDARVLDALSEGDVADEFIAWAGQETGADVKVYCDEDSQGETAQITFQFESEHGTLSEEAARYRATLVVYDWLGQMRLADAELRMARSATQEGHNDPRYFVPFTDEAQDIMKSAAELLVVDPSDFGTPE